MREYSFKVKAPTIGFYELSETTVLKSYNSLTLNPDYDYPMVIEIYGVDKYDLDLRPYFIHSNPECQIQNYIITSVFEQGERNETLSITETKNLFKITP